MHQRLALMALMALMAAAKPYHRRQSSAAQGETS